MLAPGCRLGVILGMTLVMLTMDVDDVCVGDVGVGDVDKADR